MSYGSPNQYSQYGAPPQYGAGSPGGYQYPQQNGYGSQGQYQQGPYQQSPYQQSPNGYQNQYNSYGPPQGQGQYIPVRHAPPVSRLGGLLGNGPEPPPAESALGRPPAPDLPYQPFPPTYLIGGSSMDAAFPVELPPAMTQPHPFILHDVRQGDWERFLYDLHKESSLSGGQFVGSQLAGNIVPSMLGGIIISKVVKGVMMGAKVGPTGALVDRWNQQFFHPRRMEVILAQGSSRLDSGTGPVPPIDFQIEQMSGGQAQTKKEKKRKNKSKERGNNSFGQGPYGGQAPDSNYRLFVVGF